MILDLFRISSVSDRLQVLNIWLVHLSELLATDLRSVHCWFVIIVGVHVSGKSIVEKEGSFAL